MTQTKRFVVRFTGRVQGVGFRMTCKTEAAGLSVHGFVRNESDGSVTLDIEAAPQQANELIRRIKVARQAGLTGADIQERESQGRSDGFRIAY